MFSSLLENVAKRVTNESTYWNEHDFICASVELLLKFTAKPIQDKTILYLKFRMPEWRTSTAAVSACPMWRAPVTLGGGTTCHEQKAAHKGVQNGKKRRRSKHICRTMETSWQLKPFAGRKRTQVRLETRRNHRRLKNSSTIKGCDSGEMKPPAGRVRRR